MYKDGFKGEGIIRIILNEGKEIQYASIDNKYAHKYIESVGVYDKLKGTLPCEYELDNWCIAIDEIESFSQRCYLITSILKNPKCENCSKGLIDEVTGLYNRNYLEQAINRNYYKSGNLGFTIILIDIDNLKKVNDRFGHMAGDRVIEIVAKGIKSCIRKEDLGIRYGGDEFMILLFNGNETVANKVIERIRQMLDKEGKSQGFNIEISAGIASCSCLKDMENIIKIADNNLYKEKKRKKIRETQYNLYIKNLIEEMDDLRNQLNENINQGSKNVNHEKILILSQKLDRVINKYLKNM